MSCTALMSQDAQLTYAPQLMEEPEPGVRNLQRWIEAAWSAGTSSQRSLRAGTHNLKRVR